MVNRKQDNCGQDGDFWEESKEMKRGVCGQEDKNRRINEEQA